MTIRVQYQNNVHDIVLADTLQQLLDTGKIRKFYRYSEKRWVTVGVDPVRKRSMASTSYSGPERRAPLISETLFLQQITTT